MEIKHAITGLVLGLLIIFAAFFYKDFKDSGQSIPGFENNQITQSE